LVSPTIVKILNLKTLVSFIIVKILNLKTLVSFTIVILTMVKLTKVFKFKILTMVKLTNAFKFKILTMVKRYHYIAITSYVEFKKIQCYGSFKVEYLATMFETMDLTIDSTQWKYLFSCTIYYPVGDPCNSDRWVLD
jgi:hypothetical protein